MRTTLAVEDIKVTLSELLDGLSPGEEVILTRNRQPVARLVGEQLKPALKPRPGPGLGKEMIAFISADFDAPLDCTKETAIPAHTRPPVKAMQNPNNAAAG